MSLTGTDLTCIRGERTVFAGLSFALARGGALLVQGPNGSGKSSLLRLVAGLIPLAAGRLEWQGQAVHDDGDAHRARTIYVGHLDAVKLTLSVSENLSFWARLYCPDRAGAAAKVQAALTRLGLADLASLPGRLLSAGQRRRLTLARLLLQPAPLWLLDEPAAALDRAGAAILTEIMTAHRVAGGSIVAATHGDVGLPGAAALDLAAGGTR